MCLRLCFLKPIKLYCLNNNQNSYINSKFAFSSSDSEHVLGIEEVFFCWYLFLCTTYISFNWIIK